MRIWCSLAVIALCVLAARAQVRGAAGGGIVTGMVRDAKGEPAAAATVSLRKIDSREELTTQTDAHGNYRFPDLHAGSYEIRAGAETAGEAVLSSFKLDKGETRKFDLTLQLAFSDKPNFVVAGITDTMNRGGHGSDVFLRSTEAMAKATTELTGRSPMSAATEATLREAVVREPGNARLHHSLADCEEQKGKPLEAVKEYQRAAELEESESNLFDWGAELLRHRAAEPATEVFTRGNHRFPQSLRMLLGLAAAWYARGVYDRAAERFFQACDLDPQNVEAFLFLGRVQSLDIIQMEGYAARMKQFAGRHPENAWANYYYAVTLWKQRKGPEDADTPHRVKELLKRATRIDPQMGSAYLQLGIAYSDANDRARATEAYRKAVEVNPDLEEAHYRLSQLYGRAGDHDKARAELEIYQRLSRQSALAAENERAQIRRFVYELRGTGR